MPLYKIESFRGVAIVKAKTLSAATKDAHEENGRRNVKAVTRASEQDVDWFKAMGGYVYEV